jgi:hypothetical protein
MLDVESLAGTVNTLLEDNPNFLSDLVGELDTEPLGMAVNTLLEDNPAFLSDLVGELYTEPLGVAVNTLLEDNPAFLSDLVGELDEEPLGVAVNTLLEDNPAFLSDLVGELDTDTLNTALDKVFSVVYAEADITYLVVELPPELAELLGVDTISLKVNAVAVIQGLKLRPYTEPCPKTFTLPAPRPALKEE